MQGSPQSSSFSSENRRFSNKRLNLDLNIHLPNSHYDNIEGEADGNSLEKEFNRMNKKQEKLAEDLDSMRDNFESLKARFLMTLKSKKRKFDDVDHQCHSLSGVSDHNSTKIMRHEQYCGYIKALDPIKSPADQLIDKTTLTRRIDPLNQSSLAIEDGYQWRKYGQKVTRDNPTPRAYYKCSFAPNCPVKKKVQRSLEDPSLLVAHYIGKHNHGPSVEPKVVLSLNPPITSSLTPKTPPPIAIRATSCGIDMKKPNFELQRVLAEEMASSLIQNDSFTEALAAAISSRIWDC